MKFKNKILFFGFLLAFLPALFLAQVDLKLAITWFAFKSLLTMFIVYRRSVGQEILVAFLFSLFITSYQTYVYTSNNFFIGHINIFPLVAWTAGLVALHEIYKHLHISYRWLIVSVFFIVAILSLEYIGYYILGIKIAGNPPSLFGLGIIHGPPVIHLFYIFSGPSYLFVTDYLRVE